jgi:hypothetical protein
VVGDDNLLPIITEDGDSDESSGDLEIGRRREQRRQQQQQELVGGQYVFLERSNASSSNDATSTSTCTRHSISSAEEFFASASTRSYILDAHVLTDAHAPTNIAPPPTEQVNPTPQDLREAFVAMRQTIPAPTLDEDYFYQSTSFKTTLAVDTKTKFDKLKEELSLASSNSSLDSLDLDASHSSHADSDSQLSDPLSYMEKDEDVERRVRYALLYACLSSFGIIFLVKCLNRLWTCWSSSSNDVAGAVVDDGVAAGMGYKGLGIVDPSSGGIVGGSGGAGGGASASAGAGGGVGTVAGGQAW